MVLNNLTYGYRSFVKYTVLYIRNLKKVDLTYFLVKRIILEEAHSFLLSSYFASSPLFPVSWAKQARLRHSEKKEQEREKRASDTDLDNCVDGGKLEPN